MTNSLSLTEKSERDDTTGNVERVKSKKVGGYCLLSTGSKKKVGVKKMSSPDEAQKMLLMHTSGMMHMSIHFSDVVEITMGIFFDFL